MIVYILKKEKLRKISLPEKVMGVYPILDENDKTLANIEAINDSWIIKKNNDIEIQFNNQTVQDAKIVDFGYYVIKKLVDNTETKIITTPMYDKNSKQFVAKMNTITIGSGANDSIQYNYPNVQPNHITLTKNGNFWTATTDKDETYISNRPFRKKNLFHGDYIFLYGLKIIVINNIFIINNPNNLARINSESFDEKIIEKQNITFQKEIASDTPLYSKDEHFFKAPRFKSVIEKEKVKIDEPPKKARTAN